MRNFLAGLVMAGACFASAAHADVILTDTNFTDSIPAFFSYVGSGSGSAAFSVCGSCGNPGAAQSYSINLGAGQGIIVGNKFTSLVFDPAVSGAITSIDASTDKDFTLTAGGNFNNSFRPLIAQNGDFFEASIFGPVFSPAAAGGSTG